MARALLISQHFPSDNERLVGGTYQRLGLFVQALCSVYDEVHCLFIVWSRDACTPEQEREHEARLRRAWCQNITLQIVPTRAEPPASFVATYVRGVFDFDSQDTTRSFANPGTDAALRAAFEARPDFVFVQRIGPMSAVRRVPVQLRTAPIEFDLDDVEHLATLRRLVRQPSRRLERLKLAQIPALIAGERSLLRLAATSFVCSEGDRQHLSKATGVNSIEVVRNTVRLPGARVSEPTEPVVMFVGTFRYPANVHAAQLLIDEVWPKIRARVPTARLNVVGGPSDALKVPAGADAGVTLAGFVEDIDAAYRQARVVCCPIFFGSGTRIKIIEAAGHARAIVSTALGAEGIDLVDGEEIIHANDVATLASACVRLLQNEAEAIALGTNARAKAAAAYDREKVVADLVAHFRKRQAGRAG